MIMRREYDFSQGTRGKHVGRRLRIVGDAGARNGSDTAARIQRIIEADLKRRQGFKVVWNELSQAEREKIRAAWHQKINTVLTEQPARSTRRA
jgi:polyphosphate kinase